MLARQYVKFPRAMVTVPSVRHGRKIDAPKVERITRPIYAVPRNVKDWR